MKPTRSSFKNARMRSLRVALCAILAAYASWAPVTGIYAATESASSTLVPATSTPAQASSATEDVKTRLQQNVPGLKISSVRPSPIPGLYAVIVGKDVLYTDETGTYVLNGSLFEAKTRVDLTKVMQAELSRIDPSQLPLADSFAVVHGKGTRQLYVFSDPDCPYCQRLETEFPQLDDVTIHVFLYPLTSLHPHAFTNAVGVWCSSDRIQAWEDKMLRNKLPAEGQCDNPVQRNVALGTKLGIEGTPTMVFQDGSVVAGAIPVEELKMFLDKPAAH